MAPVVQLGHTTCINSYHGVNAADRKVMQLFQLLHRSEAWVGNLVPQDWGQHYGSPQMSRVLDRATSPVLHIGCETYGRIRCPY